MEKDRVVKTRINCHIGKTYPRQKIYNTNEPPENFKEIKDGKRSVSN
jgi:hypothetical protein